MRVALAILWKDLRIEWRSRDRVMAMLLFTLLVVVIFHFSLPGGATARTAASAPGLLWVAYVLSALFGLGLSIMVAPLTATVLAAAPDEHAGIASGVNNAVARSGTLIAVAALPVAVGLGGGDYGDASVLDPAYGTAMLACAALLAVGGLVSWLTIRNRVLTLDAVDAGE